MTDLARIQMEIFFTILCLIMIYLYFRPRKIKQEAHSNTHSPKMWRAQRSGGWLTGQIIVTKDNSRKMLVDNYYTSRQLYEDFELTKGLIDTFFPLPDEVALFDDDEGSCNLYSQNSVKKIFESKKFILALEKTRARQEALRKARKQRGEQTQKNKELVLEQRKAAHMRYKGQTYAITCEYQYGWFQLAVVAIDSDLASKLVAKWLNSELRKEFIAHKYDEVLDAYDDALENYKYEIYELGTSAEELYKPSKPKKSEFKISVTSCEISNWDITQYEVEDVVLYKQSEAWEYDIY